MGTLGSRGAALSIVEVMRHVQSPCTRTYFKSFPGVKALTDISFQLREGEVHALLGENGAGKSTLMKILCGIYTPDTGSIAIDGQQMQFHSYHDAINAGVGIIFQEFSLIPYLTATENIFLGRELTNRFGLLDTASMREQALAIFQRLGVLIDLTVPIEGLSVAEQQFVEIAKALSLNARILVLDEPTATLTPGEADHLFRIMRELKTQGVGMIFISHHMDEIYQICDRITVLRDGCMVGECEVSTTAIDDLIEMMVGRKIDQAFPLKSSHGDCQEIVIEVRGLQLDPRASVNSFKLYKGEILRLRRAGRFGSYRAGHGVAGRQISPS